MAQFCAHVGLRRLEAHWLFRVYLGKDLFTVNGATTSEEGVRSSFLTRKKHTILIYMDVT